MLQPVSIYVAGAEAPLRPRVQAVPPTIRRALGPRGRVARLRPASGGDPRPVSICMLGMTVIWFNRSGARHSHVA
eukprot:1012518-Pyramimonas_sp.AAC.1